MIDERELMEMAFLHFRMALKTAGIPVMTMRIVDKEYGDRVVVVTFKDGHTVEANITMDSIATAMWDCMKQIPELKGM